MTIPEINKVYHFTNDVGYTHAVIVDSFNDKSVWLRWVNMDGGYKFRVSRQTFNKYSIKD